VPTDRVKITAKKHEVKTQTNLKKSAIRVRQRTGGTLSGKARTGLDGKILGVIERVRLFKSEPKRGRGDASNDMKRSNTGGLKGGGN